MDAVAPSRPPNYYDTNLPYVDKLEWLFVKDRGTQLSLFRAGQVDFPFYDGRIPRSEVHTFKKSNPTSPIVYWDWLANRTLAMRTDKPPFHDVRVRRALWRSPHEGFRRTQPSMACSLRYAERS